MKKINVKYIRILFVDLIVMAGLILLAGSTANGNDLPNYGEYTLGNGMEVYLIENHCLPMVHIRMAMKSGVASDSSDYAGLSYMAAAMMTSGTHQYPTERLSEMIDSTGGVVNGMTNYDINGIYGYFLSRDLDFAVTIVSEMVKSPQMNEASLEHLRRRLISNKIREREWTDRLMNYELIREIYGETGYGNSLTGTIETINNVEIELLENYLKENVCPDNAVLILSGDINKSIAHKLIKEKFGDWKKCNRSYADPTAPIPPTEISILVLDNPNASESEFLIGRDVGSFRSEDGVSLQLLNYLLGESGTISILSQRLMSEYFLVTDIGSKITWNREAALFKVTGTASHNNLAEAIDKTLAEMEYLKEVKLPTNEIVDAKNYFRNRFLTFFENGSSTADWFVDIIRLGVTPNYYFEFLKKVDKTTPEDLRATARKYFNRENMVIVVSGPAHLIKNSLSQIGTVQVINDSQN